MQDRRIRPSYSQFTAQRSVLFTTSRSASPRTRSLVSVLHLITPSRKVPRGKKNISHLAEIARVQNARVLVAVERFGNPAGFLDLTSSVLYPFDGIFIARGVRKLVGKSLPVRVMPPEREPTSSGAKALVQLFTSFPPQSGSFTTRLEVAVKDSREVLALEVKGISCAAFFFKLEDKEDSGEA